MAYFSDLSKQCEMTGCRNHDFLPFECEYCNLNFCELHRNIQDHLCPKSKGFDSKVVLCEYCNLVIPDKKEEIKEHLIYKCSYKKNKKFILVCNKKECKTVLNGINNYKCKNCKKNFCLPHRYPDVHNCIQEPKEKSFFQKYFFFF
ncbi:AN1-like zinc finger family protein [Plasmodium relictum]|uniref:AN1-like zinc finger family protein n=1 Tax=Plasmodium relictum TaxID=85471 RepID=A0A1J1H764_PLARL|nr:AN1-like zinc finger family protein [Plasmodium relictum]CRH00628.1 AN1-like zinc finger family protein [Plasmodium relictum]